LVPLWQEPGCAAQAWQVGALPTQEDGKVLGNPPQSDQSSAAVLPSVLTLRKVRAGRAQRWRCPRSKSRDAEIANSPWAAPAW